MFETLGAPELLIIMVIVVLLFGAGRVSRLGKDLGTSVKEFRRAIRDEDSVAPGEAESASVATSPQAPAQLPVGTAAPLVSKVESQRTQAPPIF